MRLLRCVQFCGASDIRFTKAMGGTIPDSDSCERCRHDGRVSRSSCGFKRQCRSLCCTVHRKRVGDRVSELESNEGTGSVLVGVFLLGSSMVSYSTLSKVQQSVINQLKDG